VKEVTGSAADGQAQRVARRFGLVGVAGELATQYGLTGWQPGAAIQAAATCYASWLEAFGGTGRREDRTILELVRGFFEAHGSSRFEDVDAEYSQTIRDRAGFYKDREGRRTYMVLPKAFKEMCGRYDPKYVAKLLKEKGWIEPDREGKSQQKVRLPGLGSARCYVFTSKVWEDEQ
jgi:uncharacterized protein (DUF927 family)